MPTNPLNSPNWTAESTASSSPPPPNGSPSPSGSSSGGGPNPPTPECTCCCECNDGQGGQKPATADSNVRSDGTPLVETPQLEQEGGGARNMGLGEGLEFSSNGSGSSGGGRFGTNWVNPHQPTLKFEGGSVYMESGPAETVKFKAKGSGFKAEYFVRDVLTYDAATEKYTVTSPKGRKTIYTKKGTLDGIEDAYGNVAKPTYNKKNEIVSLITGTGAESVGYFYNYTKIAGQRRLTKVTMRVGGITSDFDYRRIRYFFTSLGQLEKVILDEKRGGKWAEIETAYYRYFATGTQGLRFVLNDHAYEQMHSVNSAWPEAASDAELAQYADVEYAYKSDGRVKTVKTNGGKYRYRYSYGLNSNAPSGMNFWKSKTTVAMPDGSTQTYYYNEALSLLLMKVTDASGTNVWYPICQQFDDNARIILSAPSSAVASVNESSPTLFTLHPKQGALEVYEYDAQGYKTLVALKKGTKGAKVKQQEITYTLRSTKGGAIYVPATITEFRDASAKEATNPVTTNYAYTWYGGTFQTKTITVTLPAVPNSENGDGQTGTVKATYDKYGFLIEQVDAVGMKTKYQYYIVTGALKRIIEDAGAGRLNLTTDYDVDPLGRTIRTLGPAHTVSLDGVATRIRSARWTQYFDSEDEVRSISGYVKVSDGSEHCINPVQISRHFVIDPQVPGGRSEQSAAAVYNGVGLPPMSLNAFPQASYVRWSTQHYSKQNKQTHSRLYHLIPSSGLGTNSVNYAQTNYGYDSAGRQNKTTSPEGTINFVEYNAMSWTLRSLVGTTTANLQPISTNEYDGGAAGGDGNLTKVTHLVDSNSGNNRVILFRYDWRNRQTETEANDGTRTIISRRTYDNRGNVTQVDEFQTSITPANRINRAQSFFDARNRQYRSKRFGVVVGTGALRPALTSEVYYDQADRTVRNTPAGKVGFSVVHYDTAGRTQQQFRAWGGTLDLTNPGDISTATVIEQSEFQYDKAGNSTSVSFRQRFDDATGTGALQNPTVEPKARVSYVANYPDALGRTIATANYGTNGGAAWRRPAVVPSGSDTVLVTLFRYNDAGEQNESMDPAGTVTRQDFDQAGRLITTIENYLGAPIAPDKNKTTRFEYNLDGNMTKLIAENPTTGNQVTEWIYGITIAQGSALASKALVYQKKYPDSTGATDRVTYTYNRQGQVTTMVDQAGTAHSYAYDKAGRIIEDAATFPSGSTLDQTVKKITRGYEVRGMLQTVSSIGSGTTVLNQVQLAYNNYGQLAKDFQEHNGAVNSSTLHVAYSYANGSANTVRRTGITYPDGTTTITTAYVSTAADALSRPDALKEGSATLCTYRYLGAGVFIGVKYDAASDVELTYQDGGTGDAGDQYTGLDRFGRLVETLWKKGTTAQVHSQYGRNKFGGITWRKDLTAHAQGVTTEDNYYRYDGIYQVKEHQRGNLTGTPPSGISSLQQEEDFTYDATGNWQAYANTVPASSQTRTNNKANEITSITNPGGTLNPTYDPVGNMLTMPTAPGTTTGQYTLKWDAWNRLVEVKDGTATIAAHTYDGTFRRLTLTSAGQIRHFYYNRQWRAVEERIAGAAIPVDRQYTWGLRDRWDLLRRKRPTGGSSLNDVHFCLRDYLDPVAIVAQDGFVKERYAYDAFGAVRFLAPDYASRSTSTLGWDWLFHGEFQDADTGLYNYGFRYYHGTLGKWLSMDPIEEIGGLNRSTFLFNSPTRTRDELGLKQLTGIIGAVRPSPTWTVPTAFGAMATWMAIAAADGNNFAVNLMMAFLTKAGGYTANATDIAQVKGDLHDFVFDYIEDFLDSSGIDAPASCPPSFTFRIASTDLGGTMPRANITILDSVNAYIYFGGASFDFNGKGTLTATRCNLFLDCECVYRIDVDVFWQDSFNFGPVGPAGARLLNYYYNAGNWLQTVGGFAPFTFSVSYSDSYEWVAE
jgi:RHS repeat-associated protein